MHKSIHNKNKQDRQCMNVCMYNVTLGHVHATTVTLEKQ